MSDWETYQDAADRLGMTADAIRHRARRLAWRRMRANDGKTLIMVPADVEPIDRPIDQADERPMIESSSPDRTIDQLGTIEALHDRIADLQAVLEREREKHSVEIERERAERQSERDRAGRLADQVIETEKAKAAIEQAEALASAEVAHLREKIEATMASHREKIEAGDAKIEDLRNALFEMRTRSWWRRLVG
ncbi:hypothetical protein [Fulvimarina sp. MAC3]|uniref:hypothetical protein n=1 Tax=Fulvimarina sp. MAC3 TaxID=3148887 RepID=UPI0031FCD154